MKVSDEHLSKNKDEDLPEGKSDADAEESLLSSLPDERLAQSNIKENKRCPFPLPERVQLIDDYQGNNIYPTEDEYTFCLEHPELARAELVTRNARLIGVSKITENLSVYTKRCPSCNFEYQYQEWKDGIHNFNNHLGFFSFKLFDLIIRGLEEHTAIGSLQKLWCPIYKQPFLCKLLDQLCCTSVVCFNMNMRSTVYSVDTIHQFFYQM